MAETYPALKDVRYWFVRYMCYVEGKYHNDEQQRRWFFSLYEANIRHAQGIAEKLNMPEEDLFLTRALAIADDDSGSYAEAERLYHELADKAREYGNREYENGAYSQLSTLASQKGDKELSLELSRKAADVWKNAENLGGEQYFDLGDVAVQKGDLKTAIAYFEKALDIWERENDARAFMLYGMLGSLAGIMGDDAAEKKWFQRYYDAAKERGDVSNMAAASGALASYAEDHGNFQEAERQYHEALELFDSLGDKLSVSQTYWKLGNLYRKAGAYGAARKQYTEAARIARRLNVTVELAKNYVGLGHVAALEGQYKEARDWWESAAEMYDGLRDEESVALVRRNLEKLEKQERQKNDAPKPETGNLLELLKLLAEHPELLKQLGDDPGTADIMRRLTENPELISLLNKPDETEED